MRGTPQPLASTAAARTCAAPGCAAAISRSLLLCAPHWRRVPEPLRVELAAAHADFREARQAGLPIPARYRAAVRKAIQAVEGETPREEES